MHARRRHALAAIVVTLVFAGPAHAQTQWLERDGRTGVRVEAWAANVPRYASGVASGSQFVTARIPLGGRTWLVGEVARARLVTTYVGIPAWFDDFTEIHVDEWGLGNPYLGVERAARAGALRYELGLRPPFTPADRSYAREIGFSGDLERENAFIDHTLHVRTAVAASATRGHRSRVKFATRLAPTWRVRTGDGPPGFPFGPGYLAQLDRRTQLFLDYDVELSVAGPNSHAGAGLAGSWAASPGAGEPHGPLHALSFVCSIDRGPVRPGALVSFPLGDRLRELAGTTVALVLDARLARTRPTGAGEATADPDPGSSDSEPAPAQPEGSPR